MGFGNLGSSESTTSQETQQIDSSQNVSDQGVAYRANRSGNQRNVGNQIDKRMFKVAKGGTLAINNTYTTTSPLPDDFDAWRREVSTALAKKPEPTETNVQFTDREITDAVTDRATDQIEQGPATAKADKQVLWLFGLMVLLLGAGALMLGRKK